MGIAFGGECMNWMDMTLREYQAALASSSPTPGGGTAAAVALGQAASLAIMVSDLTLGKERWKEGWEVAEAVQSVAIPLLHESGVLANQDSEAFDLVMESFALPKTTEDEKLVRRNAIRQATLHAAEIPYKTAESAMSLMRVLEPLARLGNANAVTDVGVSGLLASAAGKGAIFNVEINLDSLPEDHGLNMRQELSNLKEEMRLVSRSIMDAVRERMEA
ncbi:MAG: methenyltetrahydrofolate cyclohydrolase [Euryarchaeota archaeon]|nr:methenyltetrahydrofolate cyclohydrolase [Euryarchaeota archaeon]